MWPSHILKCTYVLWISSLCCGAPTHTHTHLTALCPGLPGWAGTRKVKPIWILLKQEAVSGSSISWAVCKSAPRSRQITMPAPHHSVFYTPDALPAAQPTVLKQWRQEVHLITENTLWPQRHVLIMIILSNSVILLFQVLSRMHNHCTSEW